MANYLTLDNILRVLQVAVFPLLILWYNTYRSDKEAARIAEEEKQKLEAEARKEAIKADLDFKSSIQAQFADLKAAIKVGIDTEIIKHAVAVQTQIAAMAADNKEARKALQDQVTANVVVSASQVTAVQMNEKMLAESNRIADKFVAINEKLAAITATLDRHAAGIAAGVVALDDLPNRQKRMEDKVSKLEDRKERVREDNNKPEE